jgi:hypothetical protein
MKYKCPGCGATIASSESARIAMFKDQHEAHNAPVEEEVVTKKPAAKKKSAASGD